MTFLIFGTAKTALFVSLTIVNSADISAEIGIHWQAPNTISNPILLCL